MHQIRRDFWRSDLLTLSACTIGIWSTLTYTEFDCAALLAMFGNLTSKPFSVKPSVISYYKLISRSLLYDVMVAVFMGM